MNWQFIGKYFDTDIVLRDASLDPRNRPTRRMIANAAIGVEVDDDLALVQRLPWRAVYAAKLICPASHFCSKAIGLV